MCEEENFGTKIRKFLDLNNVWERFGSYWGVGLCSLNDYNVHETLEGPWSFFERMNEWKEYTFLIVTFHQDKMPITQVKTRRYIKTSTFSVHQDHLQGLKRLRRLSSEDYFDGKRVGFWWINWLYQYHPLNTTCCVEKRWWCNYFITVEGN